MRIKFENLGWVEVTPDIAEGFIKGQVINITARYDDEVKGITECDVSMGGSESTLLLSSIFHALNANKEDLEKIVEVITANKDYFDLRLGTALKRKDYALDIKKRIDEIEEMKKKLSTHSQFDKDLIK